jgi:hypothetical protein
MMSNFFLVMSDNTDIREATEIQNLQIADGNIMENVPVPIFMVLPRLFTCSSAISKEFKVWFRNLSPSYVM